ncbi:MAG TPA: MFS transporter [Candidatus Binatia bacterium]|nr:MFS transporter [Candidatus Binatia bacterium]
MRDTILEQGPGTSGGLASAATSHAAAREQLWTRPFALLLSAGSAFGFAFSSYHLLPKYMAVELGAGPAEIGWVAGIFGAASVVTTMAVGSCIDHVSRRALFMASAFLLAISSLAFMWVTEVGPLLYLLRIVQGVAFTMQMASYSTLIADMAPTSRLSEAVGLSGSSMLIMNAIAPAIDEPLAAAVGWPSVFALALVASLVAATLASSADGSKPVQEGRRGTLLQVARRPHSQLYIGVVFLTAIAFAAMFTFLQPLALAEGYRDVSSFFVAYAAAAVGVRLFCGWLPDRFGRKRVALVAMVLYVLTLAYVAAAGATSLVGIGAVFGLAHGVFFPALNSLAIQFSLPSERGRLMTLFAGAFNLGAWGGAAGLGVVAEASGYGAVFSIGTGATTAALVLLWKSKAMGRARLRVV